jgi:nicotinamidase/pyrazinamidase
MRKVDARSRKRFVQSRSMMKIDTTTDVLLIVDVQNDFMPHGALPVPKGDEVIPVINRLLQNHFTFASATQDWHPANHLSFASQHQGSQPFRTIQLAYGEQTVWPDHCVQGTSGAELCAELETTNVQCVIRKGFRREVDSYSAFRENDLRTPTGLNGYLHARGARRVFITGLARGYCTDFSAADAVEAGYETFLIEDACRGITPEATLVQTERLTKCGVRFITADTLALSPT